MANRPEAESRGDTPRQRNRFAAPERRNVPAALFQHPIFDGWPDPGRWLSSEPWPADYDSAGLRHAATGHALRFVDQTSLADDGCHYEQRIYERGQIATRAGNWHDLFNALVWRRFPRIKSALNRRQVEDLRRVGARQRTPAQQAMTHFDEAGAVLCLRDAALLALWDAHDWEGLFLRERAAWSDGRIACSVFGHALLEHALCPDMFLVAKVLVFLDENNGNFDADARAAAAIEANACLNDPQELRPLPLSGIPGWHQSCQDAAFYQNAPCFRPLRAGRRYPPPLR